MYTRFPDEFIKELKNRTDLVQLVKEYTKLKKVSPGVWQGVCPNPNHEDDTPSFTVWQKTNSWSCYGCHSGKKGVEGNKGSDAIAFLQWIENLDWRTAVTKLAKWNDMPLPTDKNQKEFRKNFNLNQKYRRDLYKQEEVLDYLYNRGLDDIDIENWSIGYDKFNNRIVFPLLSKYKDIIGFNKRVADPEYKGGNKYMNSSSSEIFNKSTYLYGIHNLDNDFDEIRITEGSMDVILGAKYGIKNLVATLGTAFTEQHALAIKKTGKTPVLIFDGDKAGEIGIVKAISYFDALGVYCKIVHLPKDKDLAELSLEYKFAIETYIKRNSVTAGYEQVSKIISEYNSFLYQIRLEYMPKFEEILKHVPKVEQRVLKSYIKDELSISL
jgi:DNA primase